MGLVKPIATGVGMVVVVGIAICLIVGVRDANNGGGSSEMDDSEVLSSTSKQVRAFCEPTDYKKPCVDSLNSLSNNFTATPKDFFRLAITAALDSLNATIDKTHFISTRISARDKPHNLAFQDCKALLRYAMDELNEAWYSMGNVSMSSMKSKEAELRNWLSASLSFQKSCVDIVDPPLKDMMVRGMKNASELTSNILAMVTGFEDIFKDLGTAIREMSSDIDNEGSSQRQLVEGEITWRRPHVTVAQDDSGDCRTIKDAIKRYKTTSTRKRFIIYVKAGVYKEQVTIGKDMENVLMYGDGPTATVVTGSLNKAKGTNAWRSATFAAIGNGFIGKSMGFQNTAGAEGHEAVALRVQSDRSVFYNCRIDGFQGSLYAQAHRQFYRNCVISGSVDFIFGDSATVIQNSLIIVRRPLQEQWSTVAAQGKSDPRESTGLVIQNCRVVPDQDLFPDRFKVPSFLGRAPTNYSTTIFMESVLGDFLQPAGWLPSPRTFDLNTLSYGEFANTGPGARTTYRLRSNGFKLITDRNEALNWTVASFLHGQDWIPATSTPFLSNFTNQ